MRYDTSSGQVRRRNSALYVPCSLVQLERVVICVRVLVDVLCVMVVVLIAHHTVGADLVTIFVVIFCNWRCTLYMLNNAMSRFSSGANCSFTVCVFELFRSSGCPDPS